MTKDFYKECGTVEELGTLGGGKVVLDSFAEYSFTASVTMRSEIISHARRADSRLSAIIISSMFGRLMPEEKQFIDPRGIDLDGLDAGGLLHCVGNLRCQLANDKGHLVIV